MVTRTDDRIYLSSSPLQAAHALAKRATQINRGTSYAANLQCYLAYLGRYGVAAVFDLHVVLDQVVLAQTEALRELQSQRLPRGWSAALEADLAQEAAERLARADRVRAEIDYRRAIRAERAARWGCRRVAHLAAK